MNTTPCRTHGLKSGACRRPETERQGLPMRPSHDSVRRSESSLHTVGPPVLLNSIIGTPGGRYMRLVTPLRAPFAAPIAPSHRGGLVQHFPPRQQYTASRLGTWRGPAGSRATVANAKGNLAPLLSRVGPSSMPVVVGRHEYVIKIRCSSPPHQLRLRLAIKASPHHALCVVAMQNAGRRSLQQHPCGRRSTVAARPSRTLASGDQTRYCTGDALHLRHDRLRDALRPV